MATMKRLAAVVIEEAIGGAFVAVVTHDATFASAIGGDVVSLERGRAAAGLAGVAVP